MTPVMGNDFGRVGTNTVLDIDKELAALAPRGATALLFASQRIAPEPGVVARSPEQMWQVLRPGDGVTLTDGASSHYTHVFGFEAGRNYVLFADRWPERFLVREATMVPHPSGKKLVRMSRQQFEEYASVDTSKPASCGRVKSGQFGVGTG